MFDNPFPHLGEVQWTARGEARYNCPFCPHRVGKIDTKFHLYVDPNHVWEGIVGWYRCYRCEARGPLSRLNNGRALDSRYKASRWEEFKASLRGGKQFVEGPDDPVQMPLDFHPMVEEGPAWWYLRGRGLTPEMIDKYRIGIGTQKMSEIQDKALWKLYAGKGRVVLPDYDVAGQFCYWVARTYRDHKLRYKNPGNDAGDKIYNLGMASSFDEVVITEGPFSAIMAGYNAVATYGKDVTEMQVNILAACGFSRYIVALDGDARKDALKLAEELSRRGRRVGLVEFEDGEDPANVWDIKERIAFATPYTLKGALQFAMRRL